MLKTKVKNLEWPEYVEEDLNCAHFALIIIYVNFLN